MARLSLRTPPPSAACVQSRKYRSGARTEHPRASERRPRCDGSTARGVAPNRPTDRVPHELQFNLGVLPASFADPSTRAEARGLLQAYAARPDADELRRLRCRQLLLELRE